MCKHTVWAEHNHQWAGFDQVDAVTAEEQEEIASNEKTDVGRVLLNDDTRWCICH